MALDKPYKDVPGTTIFDAEQSRKGYWLNQFCMSLMKAENRKEFKADEKAYLDKFPLTDAQKEALRKVRLSVAGVDAAVDGTGLGGLLRAPQSDRLTAEYRRYAASDPLCCPSRTTTASFEIGGGSPVVRR